MLGKLNLSIDSGAIDLKMDGFALDKNLYFKSMEFSFSSKLDWGYDCVSIVKAFYKKFKMLICSMECIFFLELLF